MTSQYCNKCGDTDGYQCSLPGCEFADPVVKPAPMLCPGCNLPMLDGQTFNGAYGCHWDCTDKVREQERRDNPRPPTESDKRWDKLKKSIDEVGNMAIRLEKERDALQLQLNDRDEQLDGLKAAACAVVGYFERAEQERGQPYREFFTCPPDGKVQENAVTISVRLLNALRAAVADGKAREE